MGWVGPLKRPETLIRAMGFVDPQVQLVFAGPIEEKFEQHLREISNIVGVTDRVKFTGALDENSYWDWCVGGWLGIQLRSGSNGESSGAVADLMASGTPVITDLPTASEIDHTGIVTVEQNLPEAEIGAILSSMIFDESRRVQIGERARDIASKWTYRDVAESVVEFIA
jgi:glycosyltransferase involved in cell wall biosynthesis